MNSKNMIVELMMDKHYTDAVKRASTIRKTRPKLPSKTTAYWIDHVIEYGGSYMRFGGQDLNWCQYFF